jgi:hypothetical protein
MDVEEANVNLVRSEQYQGRSGLVRISIGTDPMLLLVHYRI